MDEIHMDVNPIPAGTVVIVGYANAGLVRIVRHPDGVIGSDRFEDDPVEGACWRAGPVWDVIPDGVPQMLARIAHDNAGELIDTRDPNGESEDAGACVVAQLSEDVRFLCWEYGTTDVQVRGSNAMRVAVWNNTDNDHGMLHLVGNAVAQLYAEEEVGSLIVGPWGPPVVDTAVD